MSRAAALLAVLALLGPTGCGCGPTPTFTVRSPAARKPVVAPVLPGAPLRVLHLADFGDTTCQQAGVAYAVAAEHRRAPFALAVFPGDLIYPCGPDPRLPGAAACRFAPGDLAADPTFAAPADPSFARHEAALAPLDGVPVYVGLGNHDVASWTGCTAGLEPASVGRLRACLNTAHVSPRWSMPGRHYAVDRDQDGARARFIVIDSNLVDGDYGGFAFDDEVAFVAAQAAGCADRACFLVGHHPPVTAGMHRRDVDAAYLARMERLLAAGQGRIRAYLAGHDHDLQHLRTAAGLDVFVSGNGALAREQERFDATSPGGTLLFGSVRWGYGVVLVHAGGWRYQFLDQRGAPLYCCSAVGSGRCEPDRCA